MFGYTEQEWRELRKFAEDQFNADDDNPAVSLGHEETCMEVTNPWIDQSARFPLTDEQAIQEWGEDFVKEWCALAIEEIRKQQKTQ